jgi:NAD(P)-dependent dehydrogenase (short-subunit alcohol dehydrogenase family)
VFETNVVAPLGLLQAVKGVLKPGARVINVTSDAAVNAYNGWGVIRRKQKPQLEQSVGGARSLRTLL